MEDTKDIGKEDNIAFRLKERLAWEIVAMYHGEEAADKALAEFRRTVRNKEKPENIPEKKVSKDIYPILELLLEVGLANSKSEGRRLIEQGGVKINDQKQTDPQAIIQIREGVLIQVGKRRFVKIIV